MAIGTVVGALAGPRGMVAGMFSGVFGGALGRRIFQLFEEFDEKWQNDRFAALNAEIDEDDVVFVDGTLNPLGGQLMSTCRL